jgi:hypothetical protein
VVLLDFSYTNYTKDIRGIRNFEIMVKKFPIPDIPIINNKFICIVDHEARELAASISSYLSQPNHYLPLFAFPSVGSKNTEVNNDPFLEDYGLAKDQANLYSTYLNNILATIGGCEYLIFAGLSEDQKTYLDFIKNPNIIEIGNINDVDFLLSPFHENCEFMECKSSELLVGLALALRKNLILKFNEFADSLTIANDKTEGIVVIEERNYVESIIAVNYAYSVNAAIHIVSLKDDFNNSKILDLIERWKFEGRKNCGDQIQQIVLGRIGTIDFSNYKWSTFFTYGIPYSMGIKNEIPCSYVRLKSWIEFFVMNSLIVEAKQRMINKPRFGGAIVFSPQFFEDEETNSVNSILETNNFFTKKLIGSSASINGLDMHLKEFPFDILHICTHGGKLQGWTAEQNFVDRFGKQHTVTYDEVFSVAKGRKIDEVRLSRKWFPKKLNGFAWNSTELHDQNYPSTLNFDMFRAIHEAESKDKKISNKKLIPNSCFIECTDGFHQGMVRFIASHSSPIIFNNSCWSWFDMAETLLESGVRAYIGTLWAISNIGAIKFANEFYQKVFEKPIINSVHDSLLQLKNSGDEDIYVYWGLHFTTLASETRRLNGEIKICTQLLTSYHQWTEKLQSITDKDVIENVLELRSWAQNEFTSICDQSRD